MTNCLASDTCSIVSFPLNRTAWISELCDFCSVQNVTNVPGFIFAWWVALQNAIGNAQSWFSYRNFSVRRVFFYSSKQLFATMQISLVRPCYTKSSWKPILSSTDCDKVSTALQWDSISKHIISRFIYSLGTITEVWLIVHVSWLYCGMIRAVFQEQCFSKNMKISKFKLLLSHVGVNCIIVVEEHWR